MILLKSVVLLAVFCCGVISIPAYSEDWVAIRTSEPQKTEYYDADSIKRIARDIFFWSMVDFKFPVMGILSRKNYIELDCDRSLYRVRKQILYEGSRGTGQAYESDMAKSEMLQGLTVSVISEVMTKFCIPDD
jgi:hypothetical protein